MPCEGSLTLKRITAAYAAVTFIMKAKISYQDFAKPFKYNRDFYVLCHIALGFFAEENNIKYVNNVKEKYYEFNNASDLLKIRFDFNEDMMREYWHKFVEEGDGAVVVDTFKSISKTIGADHLVKEIDTVW
tara:strand:- start:503 stop:895 length:393 start_codon:yes stop_codon:yes gene_type:complete